MLLGVEVLQESVEKPDKIGMQGEVLPDFLSIHVFSSVGTGEATVTDKSEPRSAPADNRKTQP